LSLPLEGKRVVITRAAEQVDALARLLQARGAEAVSLPTIELRPCLSPETDAALASLASFDWILFTSPNTVRHFRTRIAELGLPSGLPGALQVASIGEKTSAALREAGYEIAREAQDARAEGLLAVMPATLDGQRVVFPRAREARELLPEELRARGATVDVLPLYENTLPQGPAPEYEPADAITFASGSAVEHFFAMYQDATARLEKLLVVSIGPVTTGALLGRGITKAYTAAKPSAEGLCDAVCAALASR
jgi:uroporphyrinogen III methyltransferase/synthase